MDGDGGDGSRQRKCSVGQKLRLKCSEEDSYRPRREFSDRDIAVLERRSSCPGIRNICSRHEKTFFSLYSASQKECCNPLSNHGRKTKALRPVNAALDEMCRKRFPTVIEGKKLCAPCRKRILKILRPKLTDDSSEESTTSASAADPFSEVPTAPGHLINPEPSVSTSESEKDKSSGTLFSPRSAVLERLNAGMAALGESPLVAREVGRSHAYLHKKSKKMQEVLKKTISKVVDRADDEVVVQENTVQNETSVDFEDAGREILHQLREKFDSSKSVNEKVLILSAAPKSWTKQQLINFFGTTRYMVDKVRELVNERGILCTPDPGKGKALSAEIIDSVCAFYREQDISRELPGKKDVKSVKEDGVRVLKQKRLVLGSLKEIHQAYREKYRESRPDLLVSFSTFCTLRPPECVLAGSSGTHTVCVCTTHQNFKLLFMGARINQLKRYNKPVFGEYQDLIKATLCARPTEECHFGRCKNCPGTDHLRETFELLFDENFVEEITYHQWREVDRWSLEKCTQSIEDFLDTLLESLPELVKHHYISKSQAGFYKMKRDNLEEGEALVVADFSMNYNFILQDAIQGMHWDNSSATVHPFAIYYKPSADEPVKPLNFTVISDTTSHKAATVHAFQRPLIAFLKEKIPHLFKVIYFSDNAASQYKNRFNMTNLAHHERDFGITAEWHFFAKSHGKGPSDGLGGTLKRLAMKASLQRPYSKQIKTARQLFEWANETLPNMNVAYVSAEEVNTEEKVLAKRFKLATEIKGISECHSAMITTRKTLCLKVLSVHLNGKEFQVGWITNTQTLEKKTQVTTRSRGIARTTTAEKAHPTHIQSAAASTNESPDTLAEALAATTLTTAEIRASSSKIVTRSRTKKSKAQNTTHL